MKKIVPAIIVLSAVILVLLAAVFLISYLRPEKINMDFANEAETHFFGKIEHLSAEDFEAVKEMFDGKIMKKDDPSCGFSEGVSVKFDEEHTFCFAMDTCPVICWKEKNKYFSVSEKDQQKLYDILAGYGFHFPCV